MALLPSGVSSKRFLTDLKSEIQDDNVFNGAAALAYYLTLAVFPAMIFLLALIPYLPIANVDRALMDLLGQVLPGETARMFTGVVKEIATQKGGLLSFGLIGALWAASSGVSAIMQQFNITYSVKEARPFYKVRGIALALTIGLGLLVLSAMALAVLGGQIHEWLGSRVGRSGVLLFAFAALRWVIVASALLLALAVAYYFGPNVEQNFRFITPGSLIATALQIVATLGFGIYVSNFGSYDKSYGSIGAVIVLMLWMYVTGLVMLVGSEINSLYEHYSADGKDKGEKKMPQAA